MRTFREACEDIKTITTGKLELTSSNIAIDEGLGRILAEDLVAPVNIPPMDNSAMDGYAINTNAITSLPITLRISQRIPAGSVAQDLETGTAARIFTGASIPSGANCVVIQENCIENNNDTVSINVTANPGDNIRPSGQDISTGTVALTKGLLLKPQHLGFAASMGFTALPVFRKLKVAIFSTGDELVAPGEPLLAGQIYDSNRMMLAAMCRDLGCDLTLSEQLPDNLTSTRDQLKKASGIADIIVTCGGVSVGDEDHVKRAMLDIGELDFWKIQIKPGKPFAFGHIEGKTFVGLPGNPVSAFVTFFLFAKIAIRSLQGNCDNRLTSYRAQSLFETRKTNTRTEFIRVKVSDLGVERYPNQSSGVLSSLCWADALALIPDNTRVRRGDMIDVFPL